MNKPSQILPKKCSLGPASVGAETSSSPPLAGGAVGLGEAARELEDAASVASHSTVVLKVLDSAFIVMSHETSPL